MKKRELTERQQKFLDVLFEEANGDVVQAKLLAGYSGKSATTSVVASMKEEIMEATQLYMSRNAPKAAVAMVSRVGLIKTEKVQVEASGGVMILPPKQG